MTQFSPRRDVRVSHADTDLSPGLLERGAPHTETPSAARRDRAVPNANLQAALAAARDDAIQAVTAVSARTYGRALEVQLDIARGPVRQASHNAVGSFTVSNDPCVPNLDIDAALVAFEDKPSQPVAQVAIRGYGRPPHPHRHVARARGQDAVASPAAGCDTPARNVERNRARSFLTLRVDSHGRGRGLGIRRVVHARAERLYVNVAQGHFHRAVEGGCNDPVRRLGLGPVPKRRYPAPAHGNADIAAAVVAAFDTDTPLSGLDRDPRRVDFDIAGVVLPEDAADPMPRRSRLALRRTSGGHGGYRLGIRAPMLKSRSREQKRTENACRHHRRRDARTPQRRKERPPNPGLRDPRARRRHSPAAAQHRARTSDRKTVRSPKESISLPLLAGLAGSTGHR